MQKTQKLSRSSGAFVFQKAFSIFKKHYQLIPLEVFAGDLYKTLISTLLSARTRDETTLSVSQKLFEKAPDIKALNKLKASEIEKIIHSVGFSKTKAGHLKKLAEIVMQKYNGKIPKTKKELLELPGVGVKTANLTLNRAFNIPEIAVDTHVHKISNLLGWVNTKTPEKTEQELKKIMPKKYWSETNKYMVSVGRQFRSKRKLEAFLRENNLLNSPEL